MTAIVAVFLATLAAISSGEDTQNLYGGTAPGDYLTGRFNQYQHELFVPLSKLGIPTRDADIRLRREAADALGKMYAAFRKEHPKAPFWVQSGTRNFDDQKYIWDGKWNGTIPVFGVRLNRAISDPLKRAREILKFSSMPGTSRHHWGSDFDLNVLTNEYYETGEGKVLYRWLKENAGRFGFCQPYTAGRNSGYSEERWHWSYAPLSKKFLAGWISWHASAKGFFNAPKLFMGSAEAGHLAPEYVTAINPACAD